MKAFFIQLAIVCLLTDLVYTQHLELFAAGVKLNKLARLKAKGADKKVIKYGLSAITKAKKGTVQGVVGKPLKLVGVVLGPLGLPLKLVGTVLSAKSAVNKAKAVVYTVKKLSRDSIRYG